MAQSLDVVQRKFIQEACRPLVEEFIRFHSQLNSFILDYDNQQNPIAVDKDTLNDGDKDSPRSDAPYLTGSDIEQLRTFAVNIRDQISKETLDMLVKLAVRDVNTIIQNK